MKNKIKRFWNRFHHKHLDQPKLKFIHWFDGLFPGKYCWADCVSWSFNPLAFNPFKISSSKGCEIESKDHQSKMCYCGGWSEGICFAKLSKAEQSRLINEAKKETNFNNDTLPF